MLKIFDRYIIRKFVTTFAVTLGLFIIIIIVFDVSEKLDDFLQKQAPISEIIFLYYLNYVPFFLNLFSPVFIFIAVIFFTSKLASRSEIVATLAGGVSYDRFLRPYVQTAFILAILSFALNAYIIPHSDKIRLTFENKYIRNTNEDYTNNVHSQILPNTYFYMEYFGYGDSMGGGVSLEKYENKRLKNKLFSKRISWNRKAGKWRLEDYLIREYMPDGSQKITKGRFLDTMIPFNPSDFNRHTDDVHSMDIFELDDFIEKEKQKGNDKLNFYITERYRRYSSPFSTFILTIIGVCVSSKKSRGGVGLNLGIGIFLSFIYLFIIQYFNTYGASGIIHPMLAVWIPNFIFIGVAYYLYRVVQK
ncbi:MAG TPA: LptF/LptG family permease [Bacteroidia bacterium]